jgi:hypothetical protein
MNSLVTLVRRGAALVGRRWRWRVLYAVGLITCVTGMLTGFVAAGQILTGSGSGLASAGTVTMRVNGSGTQVCDYGLLAPGDLTGSVTCTLSVTYRGSIPAHLALTVFISSKAGSGGALLYDGTNAAGLTMRLTDGHHNFTVPTGPGRTGKPCPAGSTCWTTQDDLAAPHARSSSLVFRRGDTVTFTLRPHFVAAAGNPYQGGEASVTLIAQAVQAPANPLPATCNAQTIGRPCPASGTFTWR